MPVDPDNWRVFTVKTCQFKKIKIPPGKPLQDGGYIGRLFYTKMEVI